MMHKRIRLSPQSVAGLVLVSLFAVANIGCSGCIPPSAEPEPAAPAEPDVPTLPPCADNVDCQGGEVCRDDECRTACAGDDDCDGFFGRCDVDEGVCVACIENADCAEDEACAATSLCEFFCSEDDQCAATEFCDEDLGTCNPRECEEDSECPGGFACEDYRCLNLDPIICNAETITCDDDTVVICSRDGTQEERTDCESDFVCVEADDTATCVAFICEPNEIGCIDDNSAFVCDGTGTERTDLPCRDDQYCAEGRCEVQLCVPDEVTCNGNTLLTCDAQGAGSDSVRCAETAACTGEQFGCACVVDTCVARICQPQASECVGNGFRTCNAEGNGYTAPQTCPDSCEAGLCVSSSCIPGSTECSGDVLLACNAAGNGYDVTACADTDNTCVTENEASSCSAPICEPLSTVCTEDRRGLVTCNGFGTEVAVTGCEANEYCETGLCLNEVCAPNSRVCDGNAVRACNALGDVETLTPCSENETCEVGICTAPDSPPVAVAEILTVNGAAFDIFTTISPLDDVVVTGASSTPGSGGDTIVSYAWELVNRPSDSSLQLAAPTSANTGFRFDSTNGQFPGLDVVGSYTVRLTVTDSNGGVSTNTGTLTFNAIPLDSLHIQLTWDVSSGDIDLHVLREQSTYCSDDSCYFANCKSTATNAPEWDGTPGRTAGDPVLDIDDLSGFGPENTNISVPVDGTYRIAADYYSGGAATFATMKVFINGALAFEESFEFLASGEFWEVATIQWSNGGAVVTSVGDHTVPAGTCFGF